MRLPLFNWRAIGWRITDLIEWDHVLIGDREIDVGNLISSVLSELLDYRISPPPSEKLGGCKDLYKTCLNGIKTELEEEIKQVAEALEDVRVFSDATLGLLSRNPDRVKEMAGDVLREILGIFGGWIGNDGMDFAQDISGIFERNRTLVSLICACQLAATTSDFLTKGEPKGEPYELAISPKPFGFSIQESGQLQLVRHLLVFATEEEISVDVGELYSALKLFSELRRKGVLEKALAQLSLEKRIIPREKLAQELVDKLKRKSDRALAEHWRDAEDAPLKLLDLHFAKLEPPIAVKVIDPLLGQRRILELEVFKRLVNLGLPCVPSSYVFGEEFDVIVPLPPATNLAGVFIEVTTEAGIERRRARLDRKLDKLRQYLRAAESVLLSLEEVLRATRSKVLEIIEEYS